MWRFSRPDAARALDDARVRRSLPRYVDVVKNGKHAKFLLNTMMKVDFSPQDATERLWEFHENLLETYPHIEKKADGGQYPNQLRVERSFLDLKIELGKRIMKGCHFCEKRCNTDRFSGEKGECSVGTTFSLSSCFPHLGEEPELVPSGTVFTLGCTIRCIHCQNWGLSQWQEHGTPMGPRGMALLIERLREQGCRNINMVGGDPTPYCWLWLRTMAHVDASIATVWNSNSYYSRETSLLLAGFIDLYLLDFKYGNDSCAAEISGAPGYWEACTRNHLMADRYGEVIIRVLVLPGHNKCCIKPILEWIVGNLGPWTRVNLMFQYRSEWRAREHKELGRRLNRQETDEALLIAREVGLMNLVRG
ncbi:MAG: radical SAM protein [Candidatus Bathyarchaeota archaeon]|jgi:putative pyruvate formate lyase activating enzyme|nr:radical SAM protein [Candidatus Bathyarchaeota archaeon]